MANSKLGAHLGDNCKDCKVILDATNSVFKQFRMQKRCRECFNINANLQPSRTKEARKAQYVAWKFDITLEEYNKKYELQLKGCAICKKPCNTGRELAVDHNHKTNQIRDLLCLKCNLLVGYLEEDENLVYEAIEYLKRHNIRKVS